jgi:hypothetical protein
VFVVAAMAGWISLETGAGLWPAAYLAAGAGIACVLVLEALLPYRAAW